jgi:hypothetical protein
MIHLFISNTGADPSPQVEEALRRNRACRHIDKIHQIANPAQAAKTVGWNDIAIIAENDVYFDESARLLNYIGYEECFAISDNGCSAWVFRGPPPPQFQDAGYTTYNPSLSIRVHHPHADQSPKVPYNSLAQPCTIENIRRRPGDFVHKPGRVAIIQLGRLGDIVNSLPIAYDLHRQGNQIHWYVRPEFAPLLQGVSYVKPIIWDGPLRDPKPAIFDAEKNGFDRILAIQVDGNPQPPPIKTDSYSTESWARAGYLDQYHILPCVFDQPQAPTENWKPEKDKPILAYCLQASSSPYAADLKHDMVHWLSENFAPDFSLFEVTDTGMRPDSLEVILRQCAVLLTVDTFALHMAYAAGTPTIAIIPRGWIGSVPKRNWIECVSYAMSTYPPGRDKIAAALKAVLAGDIQPGKLISQPGNPPVQAISHPYKLSILIASGSAQESLVKPMLHRLLAQARGHEEIEIIRDMDDRAGEIWEKRNRLLQGAHGEYCCFIDPGDNFSDQFIPLIMAALSQNQPDCVGFKVARIAEGKIQSVEHHALEIQTKLSPGETFQGLTHICPVKTQIAREIGFGPGGDAEFAQKLAASDLIDLENFIDTAIYTRA